MDSRTKGEESEKACTAVDANRAAAAAERRMAADAALLDCDAMGMDGVGESQAARNAEARRSGSDVAAARFLGGACVPTRQIPPYTRLARTTSTPPSKVPVVASKLRSQGSKTAGI